MKTRVGFISLGCPKNEVDCERLMKKLTDGGFELSDVPYESDVLIINTCAFIEDAKKEAIDNILDAAEYKKDGDVKKIIVTGCLPERYREELMKEIPEIDASVGIGANGDICDIVKQVLKGERKEVFPDKEMLPLEGDRILTTPPHWAYLKIAEGCSNNCAYCIIPSIRGPFRSRNMENIEQEARDLAEKGVRELILVAQDTTLYGADIYKKRSLPVLLKKLSSIDGIKWIRMLYCYPERIDDELLDTIAQNKKVLPYIDLPLQHSDRRVLNRMNRTGDSEELLWLIERIRDKLPQSVLRTTLITGFPGESEEEFENLCDFVKKARFDRLGCFSYSAEEGTPAAAMPDQIDEETKRRRGEIIMDIQHDIFLEKQKNLIGKTLECIVDGYDQYSDAYFGRTWMDAPEIDSAIYFTSEKELSPGDTVPVNIFEARDIDLVGVQVQEVES